MAKNGAVGDGHRDGAVKKRSQVFNAKDQVWIKRDAKTGKFMDQAADKNKPFKGVRKEATRGILVAFLILSGMGSVAAAEGRVGTVGISGDAGYYTYGMEDANTRYSTLNNSKFDGGVGYGAGLKVYLTENLAPKIAIDYLFAAKDSTRTIQGVAYNTRVEMPATLLFLGGEFDLLPGGPVNVKLIGGYTLVSIYDGKEKSTDGSKLDLGGISGSGSGFQVGAGLELYLSPVLSLEADLCYNKARVDGATFAGAPADPASTSSNGAVDYSGMLAKVAFTIYLGGD